MTRTLLALTCTLALVACGEDSSTRDLRPGETLNAQVNTLRLHVPPEGATLYLCPADDGHSAPSPTHDIRRGWGTFTDWTEGVHEVEVDTLGASQAWLFADAPANANASASRSLGAAIESAQAAGHPGFAAALASDLEERFGESGHPWRKWAEEGAAEISGSVQLLRIAIDENQAGRWDESEATFTLAGRCGELPAHLSAMRLSWLGDLLAHRLDVPGLLRVHEQLERNLSDLTAEQRWAREIELLTQRYLIGERIDALQRIDRLETLEVPKWAAPKLRCIRSLLLQESGNLELALSALLHL